EQLRKVIAKLPPDVATRAVHIIVKPFEQGDYTRLKCAVLSTSIKSRYERLVELCALRDVRGLRPSLILNKIRLLMVAATPEDSIILSEQDLKMHFIRSLPPHLPRDTFIRLAKSF